MMSERVLSFQATGGRGVSLSNRDLTSADALPSVLFFGTYNEASHPRIGVIREGLIEAGAVVHVVNETIDLPTAERVQALTQPWRLVPITTRVLWLWLRLARSGWRLRSAADVIVVGYLGHVDVLLARVLFPRKTIVLDHLIGLADTAADRSIDGRRWLQSTLRLVDNMAMKAADVVVFDTSEHHEALGSNRDNGVVLPVGAPRRFFDAASNAEVPDAVSPIRVVFFGLYTPLQGAETIGAAVGLLAGDHDIDVTMIGSGQDLEAAKRAAKANSRVQWIDWVESDDLPATIAMHDVCLGIFGTTTKAARVVPNKVYQGAACGTAVITSNTPCQQAAFGDACLYVEPGNADDLARVLRGLAADRPSLLHAKQAASSVAQERFSPLAVVGPLLGRLRKSPAGVDEPDCAEHNGND